MLKLDKMKNLKNKKRILVSLLLFVLIISLAFIMNNPIKKSEASVIFKPFGGTILVTVPCTCMGTAKLITVGPPNPGVFMYVPGASTKYQSGAILPTNKAVGTAIRAAQVPCLVGVPPACVPTGSGSLIRLIGTSGP